MSTTANVPFFTLNNGYKIPAVGLGCWLDIPGGGREEAQKLTEIALKHGYCHFDTAFLYGNEEGVGAAIRASSIPRSEIYVTTKLTDKHHAPARVQSAFDESLAALGLDYIDLYLMHWPQAIREEDGRVLDEDEFPTFVDTWRAMEKLLDTGRVRSIGVSNFSLKTLEKLLPYCKVIPAVNQIELHPALPQPELLEYCKQRGIHVTAYSPLGQYKSPFFEDKAIKKIAETYGKDVGQVLLSWGVLRGTSVVPRSSKEYRIKSNIELVQLDTEDIQIIDDWHASPGGEVQSLVQYPASKEGLIFGWSREQLGWTYPTHNRPH